MKKFNAFAAVAFLTLAANAQNGSALYLVGSGTDLAWAPESPAEFVYEIRKEGRSCLGAALYYIIGSMIFT